MKKLVLDLFVLLTHSERRQILWITVLMVFLSLLDLLGVGLMIPLIAVFNNGAGQWSQYFSKLDFSGLPHTELLLVATSSFLLFFILKTILCRFGLWVNHRFIASLSERLTRASLAYYLSKPLMECYKTSRTVVMNKATELSNIFAIELVNGLIIIVSEIVLILFAMIFLLVLDPVASMILSLSLVGLACLGMYVYKGRLHRLSKTFSDSKIARDGTIDNALLGLEEVKLYNAIPYCLSRLSVASHRTAKALTAYRVMMRFPRYLIELMAIFGFCLILIVLTLTHQYASSFTIFIAFVAVIVRLLPSLARLATATHSLEYGRHAFEQLKDVFVSPGCASSCVVEKNPIKQSVQLKNVSFAYPGFDAVLEHFNINLLANEFVAISAPSGSGKSTLAKLLSGLLPLPHHTQCWVDNLPVGSLSQYSIALVPQRPFIAEGTLAENIAFGATIDIGRINHVIQLVGLGDIVRKWEAGIDTYIGDHGVALSSGQQQRLGIARALYRRPNLLILDEALSGSDLARVASLFNVFRQTESLKILVVISHNENVQAYCDRKVIL